MDMVIRASVLYFFLWILLRALGKRELAEMSSFELVLLITMGDLIQQGVTQEDFSVTGALIAVGTIGLWILAGSYLSFRFRKTRPLIEGMPAIVIHDGRAIKEVMKIERLTHDELLEACREQGISEISQVRYGVLESDGNFSFIRTDGQDAPPNQEHAKA